MKKIPMQFHSPGRAGPRAGNEQAAHVVECHNQPGQSSLFHSAWRDYAQGPIVRSLL